MRRGVEHAHFAKTLGVNLQIILFRIPGPLLLVAVIGLRRQE